MGGFFGFGKSGGEKESSGQLNNVFNYALPTAKEGEAKGQGTLDTAMSTLGPAKDYWENLLHAGRTQATQNAAPAVNATLDQSDAARRQEAEMGTSRSGGTAAVNRESGATTTKSIDDIVTQALMGGRDSAAKGLVGSAGTEAGIGSAELQHALSLLGLGSQGASTQLGAAISKGSAQTEAFSRIISALL